MFAHLTPPSSDFGYVCALCSPDRSLYKRAGKNTGWAEPRTTARPPCSGNYPGHHTGTHPTCGNHSGAHATRDYQGTRHAHAQPMEWWRAGAGRPVQCVAEWSTWASRTREHSEAGCGRREGGGGAWAAETVKRPPQQPAQPRYANYWAPLTDKRHLLQPEEPRYTNHWASRAETTPAGALAAVADKTQQPDAACEGKNG